jgi:RHS repeat-associated protein
MERDMSKPIARSRSHPDGSLRTLELGYTPADTPVTIMSYFYNPRGWLSQINDTSDAPKFAEYLKYTGSGDPGYSNGNFNGLIVATDSYWPQPASGVFDSSSCNYVYDERGWLIESRTTVALAQPGPADSTITWTYDDNGNIKTASDRVYNYFLNSNRLATIQVQTDYKHNYVYDEVGNCITRDLYQTQVPYPVTNYNDQNLPVLIYQLQYAQGGKPDTMKFEYDSEGRRVKRELIHWALVGGGWDPNSPQGEGLTEPGDSSSYTGEPLQSQDLGTDGIGPPPPHWERSTSSVYYIWDGNQVIAEYQDTHDNLLGFHYYLDNMQVAAREGQTGIGPNKGRIIYWHNDHLGQPRYQCDSAGNWAAATAYSAYGRAVMDFRGGTPGLNRGFGNKNTDPTPSGMMDFGARQYDPDIGRFLSVDAAGQFATPYSYAGNSPSVMVDPHGDIAWFVPVIGLAVLGAYGGPVVANGWEFDPSKWDRDWWKSAIVGATIGAGLGAITASAIGASGMSTLSTVPGVNTVASPAWGVSSTAISAANANMLLTWANRGDIWKGALTGYALGLWSASGGVGLMKHGLPAKLSYQAIGTSLNSVGNSWAQGEDPFSDIVVGLGPVNLTFGVNRKFHLNDNWENLRFNSIGFANLFTGGHVSWSWDHLSFIYSGGDLSRIVPPDGISLYAPFYKPNMTKFYPDLRVHELHHVWHSRIFSGGSWPLFYLMESLLTLSYSLNYYETQAYNREWF